MENVMERKTTELQDNDEKGSVKIADDVVASIAGIAAQEVKGIHLNTVVNNEIMNRVNKKGNSKGVTAEINEEGVFVELSVVVDYGVNIPATCTKIQEKVKAAIENMTGLVCTDVNVSIAAVNVK